jgi:tetratricopeptide (TPR) repeat protein
LSYCCIFAGEFELALEAASKLEAFGDATGIRRAQANAAMLAGLAHATRGEFRAGIALCERALDVSPDDFETAFILACLGKACSEAGDLDRAVSVLEKSVDLADRVRSLQFRAWFRTMLAEAYVLRGDIEKASVTVGSALTVSEQSQFMIGVGLSRQILGRIDCARGALRDAARNLEEARAVLTTVGARFELARTYVELANLAVAEWCPTCAQYHRKEACDLFIALKVPDIEMTKTVVEIAQPLG